MNKQELEAIISDTSGIYTALQKEKATQALAESTTPRSGDGFTTLTGSHVVCGTTFETRHFQIVAESEYAEELLRTRTMNQAANQACNDRLLGGLRAKYDASENEMFQKRFPADCYRLVRVETEPK